MMANPRVFLEIKINRRIEGIIELELFRDRAPITAGRFLPCCSELPSSYRGSKFHNVVRDFFCQAGGIDDSVGDNGPRIPVESSGVQHDRPGILSMVTGEPGFVLGNQFLITTHKGERNPSPTHWMDDKFCAFGRVISGMDIVWKINVYGTPSGFMPVDVEISKCGVLDNPPRGLNVPDDPDYDP